MTNLQAKIIQLSAQGLTSYSQIAELAGCHPVYVGQVLGAKDASLRYMVREVICVDLVERAVGEVK